MKNYFKRFRVVNYIIAIFFLFSFLEGLKSIFFFNNISFRYGLKNIKQEAVLVDSILNLTSIILNDSNLRFSNEFDKLKNYKKKGCGGYTIFFIKLLKSNGINSRIVQLTVNNIRGGHIACEVEIDKKIAFVDPMNTFIFKNAKGEFQSAEESLKNFVYLNKPEYYAFNHIEGYSYTNWNKFGKISKFVFNSLFFINSEFAANFSFQTLMIYYKIYFDFIIFVLTFSLIIFFKLNVKCY
jgi:hypothetical protein